MGKNSKFTGAPSPLMGEGTAQTSAVTETAAVDTAAHPAPPTDETTNAVTTTVIGTVEDPATLEVPEAAKADKAPVDFSKKDFPLTLKAINNTPIAMVLAEAGVMLAPNYDAPNNASHVTYLSADHLTREVSNVDAVAIAHGFVDALLLEELSQDAHDKT